MNLKTLLTASAALAAVAAPAIAADSYFFRTKPVVEPVRPFSFDAASGKAPGTVVESAVARVSGYRGKTASVSGGEYQVCSTANCSDQPSWKSAPTANLPAEFYARVRAAAPAFGQTATARLTVGDASAGFEVASRAKDTQPDSFSFAPASGVEPAVNSFSAPVVLSGFDGAPLSVSGGGYQVCSASDCSDRNGQPVLTAAVSEVTSGTRIRLAAAPAAFGTSATATVDVGGVTASFTATARAKDETPDAIAFSDKVDQTASAEVLSEVRQLANHDGVTVSVSGANSTLRVCSDSACGSTSTGWVSSATAAQNAYVQLRQVAPAAGQTQVATLAYGTLSTTFTVKSAAGGNYSGAYALATMSSNATRKLAFVFLPAGTTISGDTGYDAFCKSKGFEMKKTSGQVGYSTGSSTAYITNSSCYFLGRGNGVATNIASIQNYGLPTGRAFPVWDYGCMPSWSTQQNGSINTTDTLTMNGATGYTYSPIGSNYGQSKGTTVPQDSVIACQTLN